MGLAAACIAAVALSPVLAAADGDPPPPPAIRASRIPFDAARLAQTAEYSRRHYGEATWRLAPRAVVLHYTCGPTLRSTWEVFARNARHRAEAPGVCAHYVVDLDGTVHELVPPEVRCRHAVGMNHAAIGVEFVQPCEPGGPSATEAALLARTAQMNAGLALVRYLRARFRIAARDVVGHATANRSPLFRDLLGRTNDHRDWSAAAVAEFHRRLGAR